MRTIEAGKTGRKVASPDEAVVIYDTREMRQMLKCGKTMLHDLMKSGQLKYRKLGNKTVFTDPDYKAFIAALPLGTPRQTAA